MHRPDLDYVDLNFDESLNTILEDKVERDIDIIEPRENYGKTLSRNQVSTHFEKHHLGYVNKLKPLIEDSNYSLMSLEEIIKNSYNKDKDVFNNAAQILNHNIYWKSIKRKSNIPNSIDKNEIINKSLDLFGSGWLWICKSGEILSSQNAFNPIVEDKEPLITIDLWEHAYYIDYASDRESYIKSIIDIIDWSLLND